MAFVHCMHTAASHRSEAVWLSSSSRQTEGGEGRGKLAQRETGALISDGLTGCVDRAVAQEEEKKSNGGTSCLKSRAKQRSESVRDIERGRGRKKRDHREERSHSDQGEGASWMKLTRTQREESAHRSLS